MAPSQLHGLSQDWIQKQDRPKPEPEPRPNHTPEPKLHCKLRRSMLATNFKRTSRRTFSNRSQTEPLSKGFADSVCSLDALKPGNVANPNPNPLP